MNWKLNDYIQEAERIKNNLEINTRKQLKKDKRRSKKGNFR